MISTIQEKRWAGVFGEAYTNRNMRTVEEEDQIYKNDFGIFRTELLDKYFINSLNKNSRILEIGCNIGQQLLMFQKLGFKNLWAIELQPHAKKIVQKRIPGLNVLQASVYDIPFKDNYFDLVFTSGVLIHLNPKMIEKALDEIHRCSKKYIWGSEYYSKEGYKMTNYREKDNMMWKTDFCKLYLDRFPKLKVVKKEIIKFINNENEDIIFLLKK